MKKGKVRFPAVTQSLNLDFHRLIRIRINLAVLDGMHGAVNIRATEIERSTSKRKICVTLDDANLERKEWGELGRK